MSARVAVFLALLSISGSSWAHATVRKIPAIAELSNLTYSLQTYATDHGGRTPASWAEFIGSGYFSRYPRTFVDPENRYFFVLLPDIQWDRNWKRLVLMAKEPGGEGNQQRGTDREEYLGRRVIYEAKEGGYFSTRVSEKNLRRLFSNEGLNLADYTFKAPDSPTRDPSIIERWMWRCRWWLAGGFLLGGLLWQGFRTEYPFRHLLFTLLVIGIAFPFWSQILSDGGDLSRLTQRVIFWIFPCSIAGIIGWMFCFRDEAGRRMIGIWCLVILGLLILGSRPLVLR